MKEYTTQQIRNMCLIGHSGTGKTQLAEAMLFSAGVTNRLGKVEEGTTISDYKSEEIRKGFSMSISILNCIWKDTKINIVDTPGYFDFIGEMKSGLGVVDNAILLLHSESGVDIGTERAWEYAEELNLPCMLFVSALTKEKADFDKVYQEASERFGNSVVPLQFPLNQASNFDSILDVDKMRLFKYKDGRREEKEIPQELKAKASELREKLVEAVAENDDELLEKYLEKGELSEEELSKGLKQGIISRQIFPVFCGDALANVGIDAFLDGVTQYSASPLDLPPKTGKDPGSGEEVQLRASNEGSFSSFVFKTVADPKIGNLSYLRVYSGGLKSGDVVLNSDKNVAEKIGQIYFLNGKNKTETGELITGDIGALVKLKNTSTNDTLCDRRKPLSLPGIDFPEPVINLAMQTNSDVDEDKISTGLGRYCEEDPTFSFKVDPKLGQTILSGQGELQLKIVTEKLLEDFGVEVELVDPRVPYRETIKKPVEAHHRHKKQSGGRGQYGEVYLKLEPLERDKGFEFVNEITGGAIPSKFIPSVEKGVKEAMERGTLAKYPVVDLRVRLYDGSYHSVDSSDVAFQIAGSMALRKGLSEGNPVLLEPIYEIEVIVPQEYMGDVIGDISSRRGKVQGMERLGDKQKIKAKVPLAELSRYSTSLRSFTQGRGFHRQWFSHYEEVPSEVGEEILAKSGKKEVD